MRREVETVAKLARREVGKIAVRQGLQIEPRTPGAQLQLAFPAIGIERHLRAVRQLADDLIEDMRGQRGRAGRADIRWQALGHLKIEVRRLEKQRLALGAQ